MADVQSTALPPLPQLVPPIKSTDLKSELDFSKIRFENGWMQWFIQLKFKVDSINGNIVSVGALNSEGFVIRNLDGSWSQYTVPLDITYGGTNANNADTARDNLNAQKKVGNTSLSATGGAASALPALPVGYVEIDIGGTIRKLAYYD